MLNFIKEYKIHILTLICFVLLIRSCGKTRSIGKFEKENIVNIEIIDSLHSVINIKNAKLDSIPEILRKEKLSIYLSLDDTISRVDRTPQLMGFHTLIKDRIKSLQK